MPNKRFLGLGFTFSATDRGLEKKLLGIQSALSGIAESLGTINSEANTASNALGAMKSPKSGGRGASSKSKDSSVSLLSELTSINKSVDKGFSNLLKGIDKTYRAASSSSKVTNSLLSNVVTAIEKSKIEIPEPKKEKVDSRTGEVVTELKTISKTVDRGFSKILSGMDHSDKIISSNLKNHAVLFGDLISSIEKIDIDVKLPKLPKTKPVNNIVVDLVSLNKSVSQLGDKLISKMDVKSPKLPKTKPVNNIVVDLVSLNKSVSQLGDKLISKMDRDTSLLNTSLGSMISAILSAKPEIKLPSVKKEPKVKTSGVMEVREERLRKDASYLGLLLASQNKLTGDTNKLLVGIKSELGKGPRVFAKMEAPISTPRETTTSEPKMQFGRLRTMWSKLNKESQEFFTAISGSVKDNMSSEVSKAFKKSMHEMTISVDSIGQVSKSTISDFHKMIGEFSKTALETDKVTKSFHNLEKAFEALKGWFEDVRNATDHFFQSIGVDFSKMIPEQFHALYGVINAALIKPVKAGLMGLGQKVFGGFKKSKAEQYSFNTWRAIGPGMSPTNNLQAYMAEVAQNTKPKKQMTMMDIFGALLAPLALVVGMLVGFADTVRRVTKVFGEFKSLRKLGDYFNDAIKAFKELSPIKKLGQEIEKSVLWFKDLSVVKSVGEMFTKIGARIGEGLEAFKAFKPISKITEALGKGFEGVSKFIEAAGKTISRFGEAIIKIGSKFKPIFESQIFRAAFGFGKVIGKFVTWIFLAVDVVSGLVKAYKESTSAIDFFGKAVFNIIDNVFMGLPSYLLKTFSKAFSGLSDNMKSGLTVVFAGVAALIAAPFLGLSAPVLAVGAALASLGVMFTGAAKGLVDNFHFVSDGFSKLWQGVKDFFSGLIDLGKAVFSNFDQFTSSLQKLASDFSKAHPIIGSAIEGIGSLFSKLKDVIEPVIDLFAKMSGFLSEKFGGALGWVGDKLSGFGKSMSDQAKEIGKETDKREKGLSLPAQQPIEKGAAVISLDDFRKQRQENQVAGAPPQKSFQNVGKDGQNLVAFKNSQDVQKTFGMDVSSKDMMNPKMIGAVNDFNSTVDKINANKTATQILDRPGGSIADIDQIVAKQNEALAKSQGAAGSNQAGSDTRALGDLLDTLHKADDNEEMKELLKAQLHVLQSQLQQTQAMIRELQKPKEVSGKLSIRNDSVGGTSRSQLDGSFVGAGGK